MLWLPAFDPEYFVVQLAIKMVMLKLTGQWFYLFFLCMWKSVHTLTEVYRKRGFRIGSWGNARKGYDEKGSVENCVLSSYTICIDRQIYFRWLHEEGFVGDAYEERGGEKIGI